MCAVSGSDTLLRFGNASHRWVTPSAWTHRKRGSDGSPYTAPNPVSPIANAWGGGEATGTA
jgi:hypothetical protein